VASQECLYIGSAGKRGLYLYKYFSFRRPWGWYFSYFNNARFNEDTGTQGLNIQLTAKELTNDCSKGKDWYVFHVEMRYGSRNEDKRNGKVYVQEPSKGIPFCPCPDKTEGQVNQQGEDKYRQYGIEGIVENHGEK